MVTLMLTKQDNKKSSGSGGWRRRQWGGGGGVEKIWKEEVGNVGGGLHKIGVVGILCQLWCL